MRNARGGRGGDPSIHQQALQNLKQAGKPVALSLGGLFAVLGVFVVGAMILVSQRMPAPPAADDVQASSSGAGGARGPSGSPDGRDTTEWRGQLADFLSAAKDPESADEPPFPGAADSTDRFTYTPLTSKDPGDRQSDGSAQVQQTEISRQEAEAVLRAVSRKGTVKPSSLAVSEASGRDQGWTLHFVVKADGGEWLEGEANGYASDAGRPVLLRVVYER